MVKDGDHNHVNELQRLSSVAGWYFDEQLDIDKQLIRFSYEDFKPYIRGPEGLELGIGDGQMTRLLMQDFACLTIVDGVDELLANVPDATSLVKVYALFEEFEPDRQFNTIVMSRILDLVKQPVALLERAKNWLAPGGRILTLVPNAYSIHRLVGVKLGLLKDPCELNGRSRVLGSRRIYTPESFRQDIGHAGLQIVKIGGTFFKPLPQQHIQECWTSEMVQGFYELGKDFPENAAEIYAVCELP